MKPYYEQDGITIYHGDCRDVLPFIGKQDFILTDPPYGINYETSHRKYKNGLSRPLVIGDGEPFDPSPILRYGDRLIIWGGNCFASRLPDSSYWLAWIKTARDHAKIRQADMELAWTNCVSRPRVFHHLWIGAFRDSESGLRNDHPTQKPEALMNWCLRLVPDIRLVLDPFMGSGTTLRAAKDLGRRAIGIEIEERYCEIAAKRLSQQTLDFGRDLDPFWTPVDDPKQMELVVGTEDNGINGPEEL